MRMTNYRTAVLIPTHDSPTRLNIICRHLSQLEGNRHVYVADSSDHAPPDYYSKQHTHMKFIHHNFIEKIAQALENVKEDYTLLHPDGELVNPIALVELEEQSRKKDFSSALSLNLSAKNTDNITTISLRNYSSYQLMAKNIACANIQQEFYISPYHQLIWGFHKTSFLRQFFNLARKIDWFADGGVNVTIFERLFNIFMMLQGKIILSDSPLFLRYDDGENIKETWPRLCHVGQWLNQFRVGDKGCQKIIGSIAAEFHNPLGQRKEDFSTLMIKSIEHEVQNIVLANTTTTRLVRAISKVVGIEQQEYRLPAEMRNLRVKMKAKRVEINKYKFRELCQKQILPFIVSRQMDIANFGMRSDGQ